MTRSLAAPPTLRRWLLLAVTALLAAGLWAATDSSASTASVDIQDFSFKPADLTVRVGDSVTWTNRDSETHAVQGGPMSSPDIPPGGTFSFTFGSPGDVSYICRIHTYMSGVVHVVTGAVTTTTTAPPSTTTTAPATTSTTAGGGDGGTPSSSTTTTSTPPPSGGPGFQDVPDDPSATYPPGTPGASTPPPTAAPSSTTTTSTTAGGGGSPGYQDVPDDPSGSSAPGATTSSGGGDPPAAGTDLGDGTFLAPYSNEGGVKTFHLTMAPTTIEVAPGVTKDAYAFNGIVPGPVLRVNEGDKIRIVVDNQLPFATGVHWHGMILPNDQDGVPGLTQPPIEPGDRYTYEFTAVATGTHWYHAHSSGRHIGKGLYGALEVVPRSGDFAADRDYRLLLGDTDLGFVINGKMFPSTHTLATKVGETVRVRVIDAGDQVHAIHLHGSPFRVVAQDGNPLPQPVKMDTLTISPGQTFDLLASEPNPGKWLLHCHIFAHSHMSMDEHPPGETGMTGMVTVLDVAPAGTPLPVSPLANAKSIAASAPLRGRTSTRSGDASLLIAALVAVLVAGVRTARRGLTPHGKDNR